MRGARDAGAWSGIGDKICNVGHIACREYDSFGTGDCALLEKPSEYPEQHAGSGENEQVEIAYSSKREGTNCCAASKHKEYVEDVAPYHIAESYARLAFYSGSYRCGEFG